MRPIPRTILTTACALALAAAPAAAAEPPGPAEIRDAIEDELFLDPALVPDRIDVEVRDGVATLSGTVTNLLARDRAARVASAVRGVEAVVNTVRVDPPMEVTDDEVRRRVTQALLVDPATETYEVDVAVAAGVATLTGTVDSWQERDLAVRVASGVAGVVEVENDIAVRPPADRPDLDIGADVRRALDANARLDARAVNVEVADGTVRLSGVVGSAAEKAQAIRGAWVLGARDVDAEELEVVSLLDEPDVRNRSFEPRSDDAIREAVETALLYDPRVDSTRVLAVVRGGRVTLRGEVDDLKAKRSAADTARSATGVVSVANRIKVRPDETPMREILQARVEDAIDRDPYLETYEIETAVHGETVRLTGLVNSWFEKARAEDAAARVSGVAHVTNLLRVDRTDVPPLYDPWVDHETFVYELPWYRYEPSTTAVPDSAIREEIADELWWSPFVDSDAVDIRVIDGVATLTGTVDSDAERRAATENAYEGGATWVENRLEVETSGS